MARDAKQVRNHMGSIESRVFPAARRFKELGAATGEEIPVVEAIDQAPRTLASPDLNETNKPKGAELGESDS